MARNPHELHGSVQLPAVARIFIFLDSFVPLPTPVYCWEIMPWGKAQCIWILWEISGSKSLSETVLWWLALFCVHLFSLLSIYRKFSIRCATIQDVVIHVILCKRCYINMCLITHRYIATCIFLCWGNVRYHLLWSTFTLNGISSWHH